MGLRRYVITLDRAKVETTVHVWEDAAMTKELTPEASLKLRKHSPTGFAFGYGGSGPAQLSLALLLDVLDNHTRALDLYQAFKWSHVMRWTGDRVEVTEEEIVWWAWMAEAGSASTHPIVNHIGDLLPFNREHIPQFVSLLPIDIGTDIRHEKTTAVLQRCKELTVRCLDTQGDVIDVRGTTDECVVALKVYGYSCECQPAPLPGA